MVRSAANVVRLRQSFDYWYLTEFRKRYGATGRFLYIKDATLQKAWFVHYNGPIPAEIGHNQPGMALAHRALGIQGIQDAEVIADLTTGLVIKDRTETYGKKFEDFFYFHIGSFSNLETIYAEFLRSDRLADLS